MPLNTILDSQSIREILKHVSYDSVLMLDLDNTVIESQLELGSDQWFVQLCLHATSELPASQNPIALVIAVYHEIQKIVRAKAVEDVIVKIIKTMQDVGIPIIAITARDHCLQQATTRQLADIGIHLFNKDISNTALAITDSNSDAKAFYEDGIIFCNGKDKGKCFDAFVKHTSFNPKHVVMVDDKLKHLEHVKSAAEVSNIRFNGIRYGYLDDKVAAFDLQMAHMQLATISDQLPVNIQDNIQTLNIPKKMHANVRECMRFFYNNTGHASQADVEKNQVDCQSKNNSLYDMSSSKQLFQEFSMLEKITNQSRRTMTLFELSHFEYAVKNLKQIEIVADVLENPLCQAIFDARLRVFSDYATHSEPINSHFADELINQLYTEHDKETRIADFFNALSTLRPFPCSQKYTSEVSLADEIITQLSCYCVTKIEAIKSHEDYENALAMLNDLRMKGGDLAIFEEIKYPVAKTIVKEDVYSTQSYHQLMSDIKGALYTPQAMLSSFTRELERSLRYQPIAKISMSALSLLRAPKKQIDNGGFGTEQHNEFVSNKKTCYGNGT